eukprot:CAMPEP_0201595098 /NCGR_PEP_ID=MMETSP0190_2-20130828/192215_1 /ASSEMBLY_ACC=CAM_ASM_000263 /TAXON_ID=37353 /ORGANISM="Rosalina sp." /LENGTH=552 /DNA_ID=CAMNT_0048054969 /DNA_START=5 /DNA_END=1659 /DNA_ORIENTATION=-
MAANLEDDKIIIALKQTLQHISLQQKKFKNIDTELQKTREELTKERDNYSNECTELRCKIAQLENDVDRWKILSETRSTKISEMQISSAKQAQKNTELQHQLNSSTLLMEEIKIKNEENSMGLVQRLEDENKDLNNQISMFQRQITLQETDVDKLKELKDLNVNLNATITTLKIEQQSNEHDLDKLRQENNLLSQRISNDEQKGQQNISNMENRIQELENLNNMLQHQCQQSKESEKEMMLKYQDFQTRMSAMSKCSFNMFELCRNIRRNISDTETSINIQQNEMKMETNDYLQQIGTKCKEYVHAQIQSSSKSEEKQSKFELKPELLRNNLQNVKATRTSLNALRKDVETELINFDKDIKSVQRNIFKQKSVMIKQMKQEQDKSAKLKQTLSAQMENEQNMEQQLKNYLKQKQELENKINSLEGFLKDKNEKDLVTEMKRFRTAAIVTSVTSLPDDGGQGISYHKLSEHERKAISLKSKFAKQLNSEININEKVDQFIKSGGLKRYPILEQEFVYEPTETESNRFRFGSKYLNIWYNTKRDELYVVEHEKS